MPETKRYDFANIYLVGYRCTGKSGTARQLARRLSMDSVDTDDMLEKKTGMCVSEIVSGRGWKKFREMEAGILREIAKNSGIVVATGGGIVLDPSNVEIMRKTGVVIWLKASVSTIISRITHDPRTKTLRPALTDIPLEQEVVQTLKNRLPMYKNASDFSVATDNIDITETCDAIFKIIRSADAGKFIRKDV